MNLFCFTLEGSTESIYEPAYSQTLKEALPKYQCSSGLLRCRPEWGGSDPSLSPVQPQSVMKLKADSKGSSVATSSLDNETLEKDMNNSCWMSFGDKKDSSHPAKEQSRETCKASCQSSRVKEPSSDRTRAHLPAQGSETAADTAQSVQTKRRLRKFQSLVQVKKGHQGGAGKGKDTSEDNDPSADVLSNNNPVLTCIGLGRRTEKSPKTAPPAERPQASDREVPQWSPMECPQPWTSFYHTCHQPHHELWVCGGTLSLPQTTEWDRFESLIQDLDNKQSTMSPPAMIRSITDLHLSQNTLTRSGRFDAFRQPSPLMNPRVDGGRLEQSGEPGVSRLRGKRVEASSQIDGKHIRTSPERALTAVIKGDAHRNEASKRETGGGRLTRGHRQSSNSLESLYSGQSSSSGVTSGSDCSSNRDSLKLEDNLLYGRPFCGRARVHTDYVPSPYDTESLRLKVGDVIEIISRPPMGIWTGMLNGRTGNFKFIYVDVLTERSPEIYRHTQSHKVRHKSAVQEVLKRLSLEEYSSSLQLNGYQTVDDLMKLKEHHLTELKVTDPEHRHRLLAAVNSLQQLRSDSQLENEANQEAETPGKNKMADMNNGSRDSGCPDNGAEDTALHFLSEQPLPAETNAS